MRKCKKKVIRTKGFMSIIFHMRFYILEMISSYNFKVFKITTVRDPCDY